MEELTNKHTKRETDAHNDLHPINMEELTNKQTHRQRHRRTH